VIVIAQIDEACVKNEGGSSKDVGEVEVESDNEQKCQDQRNGGSVGIKLFTE
jgi:hypothetical protein